MKNNFLGGIGGILGGALGAALAPQHPQPPVFYLTEYQNRVIGSAQMKRDIENLFCHSIARLRDRRPSRPWAYWQFKNGKIAPMANTDLPTRDTVDGPVTDTQNVLGAWDRSLGCRVVYSRD